MVRPVSVLAALASFGGAAALLAHRDVDEESLEEPADGPKRSAVIKAITEMKLHSDEKERFATGCGIIAWRGQTDVNKGWMQKEAVVPVTMKAFKTWPDDKDLLLLCGDALSSAALHNQAVAEEAGHEGFVELLMGVMSRWPEDPRMQVASMLGSLMSASERNRKRWLQAGGVKAAFDAMQRFPEDPSVLLSCLTALSYGIRADAEHFVEYGGPDMLVRLLKDFPNDRRLAEEVMNVGAEVAKDSAAWDQLIGKGYVNLIVQSMNANRNDIFLQAPACKNLAFLAVNETTRAMAQKEGAIAAALDVVRNYDDRLPAARASADPLHKAYSGMYQPELECLAALGGFSRDPSAKGELQAGLDTDTVDSIRFKHQYEAAVMAQVNDIVKVMA